MVDQTSPYKLVNLRRKPRCRSIRNARDKLPVYPTTTSSQPRASPPAPRTGLLSRAVCLLARVPRCPKVANGWHGLRPPTLSPRRVPRGKRTTTYHLRDQLHAIQNREIRTPRRVTSPPPHRIAEERAPRQNPIPEPTSTTGCVGITCWGPRGNSK